MGASNSSKELFILSLIPSSPPSLLPYLTSDGENGAVGVSISEASS